MKITMEFIDSTGFWHVKTGKSKAKVMEWLGKLHPASEIRWLSPNRVFVSQQYIK